MDTLRRTILAGILLGLAYAPAPWRGPRVAKAQESSGTRQRRCVVKVMADTGVVPLSLDLVEALLRSEGVGDQAVRHVANEEYDTTDEFFHIVPLGGELIDSGYEDRSAGTGSEVRTVLFELRVHLPDGVQRTAGEFGHTLLENLRSELNRAFRTHVEELEEGLREAQSRQKAARKEFEDVIGRGLGPQPETIRLDPADETVHRELDKTVDLSVLHPEMPVEEAFEILEKSVDPPLKIVVLWRDLLDNADIEPSSPINMKGSRDIRLGTGLENLICAISNPLYPDYPIEFAISHGVITVATVAGLPKETMETRTYDLPLLIRASRSVDELIAIIQETIEPESWSVLYPGEAEGAAMSCCDVKLVVRQSRRVHMKIQELLRAISEDSPALPTIDVSEETLRARLQALLSYRASLEADMDRLQERRVTILTERNTAGRQLVENTLQSVITELHATIRDLQTTSYDPPTNEPNALVIKIQNRAIEKVQQCINRCHQTIRDLTPHFDATGARPPYATSGCPTMDLAIPLWVDPRSGEDQKLAKEVHARQAALVQANRRIAEVQRTLAGPRVFDPEVSRIQAVSGNLRRAEERVHDLNRRIAELEPCSVVILGGMD